MKWSIAAKIGSGFALVLIALSIIGFTSYQNATGLLKANVWRVHTYVVLDDLQKLLSALQDAETGQRGYIITGIDDYLAPYNTALQKIKRDISELQRLTSDNPAQQQSLDSIQPLLKEKLDELARTIKLRREQGFAAALPVVKGGTGKQVMDEMRAIIARMKSRERSLLEQRDAVAGAEAQRTVHMITYGIPITFVLITMLAFWLTRNISLPISRIAEASTQIAVGDLSADLPVEDRADEVGVLAVAFNAMMESLRGMANTAREISNGNLQVKVTAHSDKDVLGNAFRIMVQTLKQVMGDLSEGANVLASASGEIVATTSQVASGASETATAVAETTSTVEEVKRTAELSSEKARNVSETAQKAVEVSRGGTRAVELSIAGVEGVRKQVDALAQSIVKLSEQSQAIGEIIETVNDLSEQSNLLAVNASIEAAKAGEQGKGFSVVAQEIRNLAEQSKAATSQVRKILGDIQKATTESVLAAEQGSKAVEAGAQQTREAGESIAVLAKSIEEAAQAARQIAASSQQQQAGMDQVAQAMENIREASTQNVTATKQAESSAQNLSQLGERLKNVVSNYRI